MKKIIEFAKNELHISKIIGRYVKENIVSGNVMRKLGFVYKKDIIFECNNNTVKRDGIQCELYL